ncbi:MAG: S9 family peptidase [Solobacterium sp.]|nr:S9 family peptidase [Solobacterium sp.]
MRNLKPIEINDITTYRFPENLQYNEDGSLLAYTVIRSDVEKNTYHRDMYLCKDQDSKQITFSIDASVVCFDDAETLILRRRTEETKPYETELFKLNVNGGEAKPWLTLPFGMGSLKKVKENLYVVTGAIDALDADFYLKTKEEREKKIEELKKEEDYEIVDEVPYWANGVGYTNKKRNALFLVDTKENKIKRLTSPYFSVSDFIVEGNTIYYAGQAYKNKQSLYETVYAYQLNTKKTKTIYGKKDHTFGKLFVLQGQLYAYASDMKKYGINETLNIYEVKQDTLTCKYVPEISHYSSVISDTVHGGNGSYYTESQYLTLATQEDHNVLYQFDKNFKKKELFNAPGMVAFFTACKDKIALCYQDERHVAEVYELNRKDGKLTRVSHLNDEALKGKYIAKCNPIKYQSEGIDLKGWVLLPQNFNPKKKYPAILDVHGGPRAVYGETFFHEMQAWASKGYVVFFTNIRGSDGRGDAFADIRGLYGDIDYKNLMDFTDAVLKKYPNIDKKRMCETGGSYGGFMTNWIITHTNRFCCAASQRSISNWISMSFISDIGLYFGPDQCGAKDIYTDTEALWRQSPLKYAKNAKTPTLFIHSTEDYRCPLPDGMQMMQALANRNIETRLVIFKGENHELSRSGKPLHRLRRLNEITEWFDKHTK